MASPNQASGPPGPVRQGSFSGASLGISDPRNPRIDTIIHAQAQQSSSSSGFDTSSPVSPDYNFGFGGSPHGSSNSGIDVPPDFRAAQTQGMAVRTPMSGSGPGPQISSQQHRTSLASIDSAFDQDVLNGGTANQWTPTGSNNHPISNSDDSPRKTDNDGKPNKTSANEGSDQAPAWSELKTKAGKERKRLPLACIACRRKKIRCSGEKPACKHCLRARVPCVYKVTTRKAAPRTDYMAMLDKRLKRMEDRVIKVIPKDELPDLSTTGRASVRPPLPGQTPKAQISLSSKKRSADDAFTSELADWTQSRHQPLLLSPTSGLLKQRDGENKLFIEGSESLPPQHIQEHLAEVFFDCVYGQSYLLLHKPSFLRKLKAGTVPPVLILAVCAISARFSTHPQCSTEPAFLRGEQWATPARHIIERRHYEPNITILIAMLMLGLHYFGTCEGGLSWSFGGQAMRMGYALQLHRELDHDPLGRNQIIGSKSTTNPPSTKPPELSFTDREIRRRTMWACYLMDTFNSSGTERPSFLNEDYFQIQLPISEENFLMEHPGTTEDLNGNLPSPTRKHATTTTLPPSNTTHASLAKSNMGVAAYIVRGVVLWKRIVKYLNLGGKDLDPHPIWDPLSQFSTLARSITTLRQSLPPHLTYTATNLATHASSRLANQFLFLHIILSQTSLFLHRFAIPSHPSFRPHHHLATGMPRTFLTTSASTVLESANTISHLIAASTGHTLTVPFAGYCAYASATVHVWGIFSSSAPLVERSKDNLRHNYKYLTRMKRYWGMFHYMAETVKDTYRAFADASVSSSGGSLGAPAALMPRRDGSDTGDMELSRAGTPSSREHGGAATGRQMFQYGDWFDKYPHGVSESEWESSHLEYKRDGDKGSEAVMSQRSDLQSVEEFFASLSPPSKADDAPVGRKKVARRRGKSVEKNKEKERIGREGLRASISASNAARPQVQRRQSQATGPSANIDLPAFPTDFDVNSPPIYQTPQMPQSATSETFFSPNSNMSYNYTSTVPHLDRQMVFGAYAGIDPSSISSNALNQNTLGQNPSNSWGDVDINGFNFNDSLGGNGMGGGSAWFMPFNIEPPNFDGMEELGSGSLDGMDFGDLSGMGNDARGSFSTQGGQGQN